MNSVLVRSNFVRIPNPTEKSMTNPITNVMIPDADLAKAVREALNLKPGEPILQAALQVLKVLDAAESDISDLTGLEKATGLTALQLSVNSVSDISPIAKLQKLESLDLSDADTSVSDVRANREFTEPEKTQT